MKIQAIDCHFTKEEWLHILKKTFDSETVQQHQGHSYIYLNQKGMLKNFFSSLDAYQEQFKWKLTIDDIILLSKQYFDDYQGCQSHDSEVLQHTYQLMDKGAQRSWWVRLLHWFRGLGFKNTHELIEEQLLLLIEQQISSKQQQLGEKLEYFRTVVRSLNDERFDQAYTHSLTNQQAWLQTCEKETHRSSEEWKNREEELTDILLEVEQKMTFSAQVRFLVEQKETLERLLVLVYPQNPIKEEKIQEIELALNQLVHQMFDKFTVHDQESYQKQLKQLGDELGNLQSLLLENYESQENYQSELVEHVYSSPKVQSRLNSPLKIFSLKKHTQPEETADATERIEEA